jgi:hypothetical protein
MNEPDTPNRPAWPGQITLPPHLVEALAERFVGESFPDVSALIAYIAAELLKDDALGLDGEEQRIIEQRLADLGYIDG